MADLWLGVAAIDNSAAVPAALSHSPGVGRAVLLSGGYPSHDTVRTSARIGELIAAAGLTALTTVDPEAAFAELPRSPSLLVVNGLWHSMREGRLEDRRYAFELSESAEEALAAHIGAGLPVLVVHAGLLSFDQSDAWRSAVGVRWYWETSHHPRYGQVLVTAGRSAFSVSDELYMGLEIDPDARLVAVGSTLGASAPCAWRGTRGRSRWGCFALGHDTAVYSSPEYRVLFEDMIRWLAGASDARFGLQQN